MFEPLDFLARLAALVPPPRVNLTRYHGVFASNSRDRGRITPAGRGKGAAAAREAPVKEATPPEPHRSLGWARCLARVFKCDVRTCPGCGGPIRLVACIEDPGVIRRVLSHVQSRGAQWRGLFPESQGLMQFENDHQMLPGPVLGGIRRSRSNHLHHRWPGRFRTA